MAAYHFVTRWRVPGTCGEVADILGDVASFPRWWPSVHLDATELAPPGPGGVGHRIQLTLSGWLPSTLSSEFLITESRYPFGFTVEAEGHVVGCGVLTLAQDGSFVDVVHDWNVRVGRPLVGWLSWLAAPLVAANHRWAMRQGEESLTLELLRRRASNADVRARVSPPPGPVTYAGVVLIGGATVVGGTLLYLMLRARRRSRADES